MKKLNFKIILIIFLVISLTWNIYFLYFKKWEIGNNNSCLIMYWDYYLNTPKNGILDFDENFTKECIKENFWKKFYIYDGITERILEDLKKYKEKKWDIPKFYKKILKDKFYKKYENDIDYSSIKLALDLIWDDKFRNSKLIKDILSNNLEK
jgi:hypothetical protein